MKILDKIVIHLFQFQVPLVACQRHGSLVFAVLQAELLLKGAYDSQCCLLKLRVQSQKEMAGSSHH